MIIRLSKAAMVLAMAFFATLVAFGNITDYATNFAFVHHVFLMDTTFPGNGIMYRSIQQEWIHHAGYIGIITLEGSTAILCWIGGFKLLATRANQKLAHLHPAADELQRALTADLPIACGPDEALQALQSLPTA